MPAEPVTAQGKPLPIVFITNPFNKPLGEEMIDYIDKHAVVAYIMVMPHLTHAEEGGHA